MLQRLLFLAFLSFAGFASGVKAQVPPDAMSLFRNWLETQGALAMRLTQVDFTEEVIRVVDNPFGTHEMVVETAVSGSLRPDRWERTPLRVVVNGNLLPPDSWNNAERRWRTTSRADVNRLLEMVALPLRILHAMRPAGPTQADEIDGVLLWRFEVIPADTSPIERITLWMDRRTGHLRQSRAIIRAGQVETPVLINITYERVQGLDVPRVRTIEATVQRKRRMRLYTTLLTTEATYRNYRFVFRR